MGGPVVIGPGRPQQEELDALYEAWQQAVKDGRHNDAAEFRQMYVSLAQILKFGGVFPA